MCSWVFLAQHLGGKGSMEGGGGNWGGVVVGVDVRSVGFSSNFVGARCSMLVGISQLLGFT